jgi:GWxTD domain-containing protein
MRGICHIFIVAVFAGVIAQAQTATSTSPRPAECRKWINEDVPYIITDKERRALKQLKTSEECDAFIEEFWLRRDPTPGTPRNEFKEEHYRRIKFANDHFGTPSGVNGWKTDRGHIYIAYGPPDEIDAHPSGDPAGSRPPYETWLYSHIPGIGSNVRIEFVDPGRTGTYLMNLDQGRMIELTGDKYVADFASTGPGPQLTMKVRQDRTLRIGTPIEGPTDRFY